MDRSRSAIFASRASISRSKDLIGDSLKLIAKPRSFALLTEPELTDEQEAAIVERWQAAREQRQIDNEIRQTVWGGAAAGTAIRRRSST